MARKLFLFAALISLVVLAQASPGLTATYTLPSEGYDCLENFIEQYNTPGSTGSELSGWHRWGDGGLWIIGGEVSYYPDGTPYKIKSPVQVTDRDGGDGTTNDGVFYTFVYTYDAPVIPNEEMFTVDIPGGPSFVSYDVEFTITATYLKSGDNWTFEDGDMVGSGYTFESFSDGTPFTLSASIILDSQSYPILNFHFENFELTYPASAVPIPGSVWLLGTGLLGLFCLGRRRKG